MNGNRKGSQFERQICKRLSAWWAPGRDDVFWRSSQSGGRATQRAKSGKSTFGSYGDIAAVDPIGAPLIKVFTIELKRGKSHGCPTDLIDLPTGLKPQPFEKTLRQVMRSAEQAGSISWLIISQRDRRLCMVYGDWYFLRDMGLRSTFKIRHCLKDFDEYDVVVLGGLSLVNFLQTCSRQQIIKKARSL